MQITRPKQRRTGDAIWRMLMKRAGPDFMCRTPFVIQYIFLRFKNIILCLICLLVLYIVIVIIIIINIRLNMLDMK